MFHNLFESVVGQIIPVDSKLSRVIQSVADPVLQECFLKLALFLDCFVSLEASGLKLALKSSVLVFSLSAQLVLNLRVDLLQLLKQQITLLVGVSLLDLLLEVAPFVD